MADNRPLTEAMVAAAVAAGSPDKPYAMLWDGAVAGLGLKIRSTGAHSWIYRYRPKGAGRTATSRTVTVGKHGAVSLKGARDAAKQLAGAVAAGGDPAVTAREAKNADRMRLDAALDRYETALLQRRYVNVQTAMSTLRRNLAHLVTRDVASISLFQLVETIDGLEGEGKFGAAEFFRKHAQSFFKWAKSRGYTENNPLAGYIRAKSTNHERRVKSLRLGRALDDREIVALWDAAGSMGNFGAFVQFGLLTGMRRGELAGLRWDEIGEDRITLPRERTKMDEPHEITLTPAMREILDRQAVRRPDRGPERDIVFFSEKGADDGQMSGWNRLVSKLRERSSVQFTLHDLRRTFRTILSRLGVQEDVAELCIAHKRPAFVALYNKDKAWSLRVNATMRASAFVTAVVNGDPVGGADIIALDARRA